MDNNKVDPSSKLKQRTPKKTNIIKAFKKIAHNLIKKLHNSNQHTIYRKIANDIVYNEKSHIVAVFKDYLIYDDSSEFLKR